MAESPCPQCGFVNPSHARFCGSCAAPLSPPEPGLPEPSGSPPPSSTQGPVSNKGLISLILGILGLVMCGPFTGVPGIIFGKMEMDAIKQGTSPQSNMGVAKAGFYISIAAVVLSVLFLVLAILFGLLGFFSAFGH